MLLLVSRTGVDVMLCYLPTQFVVNEARRIANARFEVNDRVGLGAATAAI